MSRDITEFIDDACEFQYGHTDWTFTDSPVFTDKEKKRPGMFLGSGIYLFETSSLCKECNSDDLSDGDDVCSECAE